MKFPNLTVKLPWKRFSIVHLEKSFFIDTWHNRILPSVMTIGCNQCEAGSATFKSCRSLCSNVVNGCMKPLLPLLVCKIWMTHSYRTFHQQFLHILSDYEPYFLCYDALFFSPLGIAGWKLWIPSTLAWTGKETGYLKKTYHKNFLIVSQLIITI